MTDIQPNENGKIQQTRKRLKKYLRRLENIENLNANQRDRLFSDILYDLIRLSQKNINK